MLKQIARKIITRKKCLIPFPDVISIELTTKCNLACVICPHKEVISKQKDMDFKLFTLIMNELKNYIMKSTTLSYVGLGEPFLYKKLIKVLKYSKIMYPNVGIRISTNGTKLNTKILDILGKGDKLVISLNTDTQEKYFALTGHDKFNEVEKNIKKFLTIHKLKKSKLTVSIQLLELYKERWKDFSEKWNRHNNKYIKTNLKKMGNWDGRYNFGNKKIKRYPCFQLWRNLIFTVQGKIYPCCRSFGRCGESLFVGKVGTNELKNSLEKIRKIRTNHQKGKWNLYTNCINCDAYSNYPNFLIKIRNKYR